MKRKYFSFYIFSGAILVSILGFRYTSKDVLTENLDIHTSPRNDFFQYANGGWIKNNPIPASESNWGIGNLVTEEIKEKIRILNEKYALSGGVKGSDAQKVGDFYKTGMDSITIESLGMNPVLPFLRKIDQASSLSELWRISAECRPLGLNSFFSLYLAQDEKNSDKVVINISQGGLGMPNRDYYLKTDGRTKNIQANYKQYVNDLTREIDWNLKSDSSKSREEITSQYQFEKELAIHSRSLQDLRDPIKNYHKLSLFDLSKISPHVNWKEYLDVCGLKNVDTVLVGQPEYVEALDHLIDSLPLPVLKHYLEEQFLSAYSPFLSRFYYQSNFHFYGTVLRGQKVLKPRWKRVLEWQESSMGMLLGRLFIHDYFSDQAKLRYSLMVDRVLGAFENRIQQLTWMSPETKAKALIKLHTVHKKVGYPDQWKDFSNLNLDPNQFIQNIMACRKWAFQDNISRFGKPVNRSEWHMTPQTYNAYYNPSNNEIVLPAAQFMVPGMKDEDLDDAIAYGYTAASTIGHEITHGFDDEGRQFDEKGNLKDWWGPSDTKKFQERAQVMVNQFNAIVVLDSLHINGQACLGENIADLGGIIIGLDAFKKTEQFKEGKSINGLSPVQRFFMGYALGWLGHERDQSLANQILTDVHAPGKYRVNAPMKNVPEFYTAFGIKPGDPMYLDEKLRVRIW